MASKQKTVLIVYAHPEPKSFNGALKNAAAETLREAGYLVEVSDLYEMNFNPVCGKGDVVGDLVNPDFYKQSFETGVAYSKQRLAPDITAEIDKLRRADLVIFQFPMYWHSVPAIMKGWIDRVLVYGFAFADQKWFSTGMLQGKKALLSLTTEGSSSGYSPAGLYGDINVILWHLQSGVLRFCGMDVLAPQVNFSVAHVGDENRKAALQKWRDRLRNIDAEQPLQFGDLTMFSSSKGNSLTDDCLLAQEGKEFGLSVGTHMGKRLPTYPVYP